MPHEENGVASFLEGIELEWDLKKHLLDEHEIVSIYLGGGTPSLLTPLQIESILSFFPKADEITLEANPEDVSFQKMLEYRKLGINRVSIGVQSLDESTLYTIGRNHSSNKAVKAIEDTFRAGIENISIDLMYDLPNQTFFCWKKTIDKAIQLPITHLSLYNMTLEIGSLYYKDRDQIAPLMPKDELSIEMLNYAVKTLQTSGFDRYEISAFCKNGQISQHNIGYWTARPFVGLGPSAFSYYQQSRLRNICHLNKWKKSVEMGLLPIDFQETLPHPDNIHELIAVGLRVAKGIDINDFPSLPKDTLNTLNTLVKKGFLATFKSKYFLTETGKLFYDDVASEII